MAVRVADNLKTANDSTEFPVAYGEDIWLDKNKGSGTPDYASIQSMLNNDELGGGGSSIQVDQMPLASADTLGQVLQFTGATGTYIHNYFYECVSDGETPPTYSWVQKNVQPSNATAAEVSYDNTTSELAATNVQGAVDEVVAGLGTAAGKDFTDTVRPGSHDLVESMAVYSAINNALESIYTPRGDLTCAELTSALLIEDNVGSVYQMSDSGVTSALFINGVGIAISAGDNVGIIKAGADTYMFNYMGSAFDLHDYNKVFTGTQAQWEALTTAEKTQYDEAHITDDEIEPADYVADYYKTTETKTDKIWIDGRPIYRKVLEVGNITSVGTTAINHGISSLDKIINYGGNCKLENSGTNMYNWVIPYLNNTSSGENVGIADYNSTTLTLYTSWKLSNVVLIIEYTKSN